MAVLSCKVNDDAALAFGRLAAERGTTTSALLRAMVDSAVAEPGAIPAPTVDPAAVQRAARACLAALPVPQEARARFVALRRSTAAEETP